ncbi:MAG: hypothetical protein QOD06_1494 [Candidatus Binatota bacterium]|nr:hypothetical protein [Candidatus Binatota bacterium]
MVARLKVIAKGKLFIGLKLDPGMRRRLEEGPAPGRPTFKAGDPAHLETVESNGDVYLGRVLDRGVPADQIGDLERNIRSIVRLTFPDERPTGTIVLLPLEEADEPSTLAAAN